MFTSSEIKNIMSKSHNKMGSLLKNLGFAADAQCSYSDIDSFITREVCRLMKSESIPEGYSFLLRAGGIPLDFSGTPNERLAKVVANRRIIEPAINIQKNISSSPQYETRFIVSPLYSRSSYTVKEALISKFNSFIDRYTNPRVYSGERLWGQNNYISQEQITTQYDFKKDIKDLKELMGRLPDTVNTCEFDMSQSHEYRESELIEFLNSRNKDDYVAVSTCRVKCNAPQPDLNRKFTSQEAARMFAILEQINALVSDL